MVKMASPDFFQKVQTFSKKSPFLLKWLIFQKFVILVILLYTNTFPLPYKYFKTLLYLKIKPCKDNLYKICIRLSKITMVIELLFFTIMEVFKQTYLWQLNYFFFVAHCRKKRAMFQVVDELELNVRLMWEIQFGRREKYIYDLSPIQNKKYI